MLVLRTPHRDSRFQYEPDRHWSHFNFHATGKTLAFSGKIYRGVRTGKSTKKPKHQNTKTPTNRFITRNDEKKARA